MGRMPCYSRGFTSRSCIRVGYELSVTKGLHLQGNRLLRTEIRLLPQGHVRHLVSLWRAAIDLERDAVHRLDPRYEVAPSPVP